MSLFEWNSSYEFGIDDIDNQHRKLVRILNSLWDAYDSGSDRETIGNIIDELVFYTKIHFNNEEKYMEEIEYGGLKDHRVIHRDLTSQVFKIQEDFKAGKAHVDGQLLDFLKNWLSNHILVEDKKYTQN